MKYRALLADMAPIREIRGMKLRTILPLLAIVGAVVAAIWLLRTTDEARKPAETTPVPGFQTQVFDSVNQGLAMRGLPTNTPGLSVEEQMRRAVQATLTTATPLPTHTLIPSNTPLPTHTLISTRTLVPGLATQIHVGVQETLQAQGSPTYTPGVPLEVFVQQAIEATTTAGYDPQN